MNIYVHVKYFVLFYVVGGNFYVKNTFSCKKSAANSDAPTFVLFMPKIPSKWNLQYLNFLQC